MPALIDVPTDSQSQASGPPAAPVEFGRGYEQARLEALALLVPVAEAYLRGHTRSTAGERKLIYGFVQFLETHLDRTSNERSFVAGGLGI